MGRVIMLVNALTAVSPLWRRHVHRNRSWSLSARREEELGVAPFLGVVAFMAVLRLRGVLGTAVAPGSGLGVAALGAILISIEMTSAKAKNNIKAHMNYL